MSCRGGHEARMSFINIEIKIVRVIETVAATPRGREAGISLLVDCCSMRAQRPANISMLIPEEWAYQRGEGLHFVHTYLLACTDNFFQVIFTRESLNCSQCFSTISLLDTDMY